LKEVVQTTLRFPASLMKRLKQVCLDRETNQTAAIIAALEVWMDDKRAAPIPPISDSPKWPGETAAFRRFLENADPIAVGIAMDMITKHQVKSKSKLMAEIDEATAKARQVQQVEQSAPPKVPAGRQKAG
jgi:hypothetical protein